MTPEEEERLKVLEKMVTDQSLLLQGFALGQTAAGASSSSTPAVEEEGPYVPHYSQNNPHAARPNTVSEKPQHFELYGSNVWRMMDKQTTGLKYEYRTLEPALSYLYDAKTYFTLALPGLVSVLEGARSVPAGTETGEDVKESDQEVDDQLWGLAALQNSLNEIYVLLTQRSDYIGLKTKYDVQPGGITVAEKALLNHLEIKLHGMAQGITLVNSTMNQVMIDFGEKASTASLNFAAKQQAKGGGKGGGKGAKGGKGGKGGKGAGKGLESHP